MVRLHSICLEHLEAADDTRRWLCCTSTAGGSPGLRLLDDGVAAWQTNERVAAELFTSADERFALLRVSGGCAHRLRRAGRNLDVPEAKPVILIDGDRIEIGGRTQLV